MHFWLFWGKFKQVLCQLGIYFSMVSMAGVMITAWHTTVQPILWSYNVRPSLWTVFALFAVPIVVLIVLEWHRGTEGYFQSFSKLFYTSDSKLRQDVEALQRQIAHLERLLEERNESHK